MKTNGSVGLAFSYIQTVVWDIFGDVYLDHRDVQIKLGRAADMLDFLLAVALIVSAGFAWIKKRSHGLMSTVSPTRSIIIIIIISLSLTYVQVLALIAIFGLVLATLFQLIIIAAFVLPNWGVITSGSRWREWSDANEDTPSGEVLQGFLRGYWSTVNGFPIVEAVILPTSRSDVWRLSRTLPTSSTRRSTEPRCNQQLSILLSPQRRPVYRWIQHLLERKVAQLWHILGLHRVQRFYCCAYILGFPRQKMAGLLFRKPQAREQEGERDREGGEDTFQHVPSINKASEKFGTNELADSTSQAQR